MTSFPQKRRRMVERQLVRRGISDPAVLSAMESVPREEFLPPHERRFAYHDRALPIDERQTISQPYVVALMAEAAEIETDHRVLEIGTGSGYNAAVLSHLAADVYSVEYFPSLADAARARFAGTNVHVRRGNGRWGWPEHAPYDAIVVTAAAEEDAPALLDQLAPGGRLIAPVGPPGAQQLLRIHRTGPAEWSHERITSVRFVPLL